MFHKHTLIFFVKILFENLNIVSQYPYSTMIVACISSSQKGRVLSHSHKVVCTKSLITNAPKNFIYSAAAPEIISISSLVMTACLVLLKVKVSLSIISPGTKEFI